MRSASIIKIDKNLTYVNVIRMPHSIFSDFIKLRKYSIFLFCGSCIGILTGLFWLDQRVDLYFLRPELQDVYYYSREITNIGYSSHYFIISIVCFLWARYLSHYIQFIKIKTDKKKSIEAWSLFALKALLTSGIIIQITKMVVGRQRPHVAEGLYGLYFEPFTLDWHQHSFPSGHTQVLFTVATVLFLRWPRKAWLFFTLAFIFAFTRVTTHQHYLSDLMGGALVGHLITLWTYYKWPPRL